MRTILQKMVQPDNPEVKYMIWGIRYLSETEDMLSQQLSLQGSHSPLGLGAIWSANASALSNRPETFNFVAKSCFL